MNALNLYSYLSSILWKLQNSKSTMLKKFSTFLSTLFYRGGMINHDGQANTQPTRWRRKDVVKTSSFWSQKRLRFVWNGSCDDLFLRRPQDVFQETSWGRLKKRSSRLPFQTNLRRLWDQNYDVFTTSLRRPQDVF